MQLFLHVQEMASTNPSLVTSVFPVYLDIPGILMWSKPNKPPIVDGWPPISGKAIRKSRAGFWTIGLPHLAIPALRVCWSRRCGRRCCTSRSPSMTWAFSGEPSASFSDHWAKLGQVFGLKVYHKHPQPKQRTTIVFFKTQPKRNCVWLVTCPDVWKSHDIMLFCWIFDPWLDDLSTILQSLDDSADSSRSEI